MSPEPPVIASLRPEPARDEYGRYLLPDPGSGTLRAYTRATTLAHALDDTAALTRWKRRMVLQGAAADPTLLATVPDLAAALDYADGPEARDIKQALDAICDSAADTAGANIGSGWGTALHTITEWYDAGRGTEIEVPADLAADLAAYQHTLDSAGIGRPPEHIERIVVNTTTDTAGTYDRLLTLPDGRLVVGDLKTQQTIYDWLGIATQLAQYAYASCVYTPDLRPEPLPAELDITRGIVIHIPARSGQCTLYEVDLVAGWEAAQLAHTVRQMRADARRRWGWQWQPPPAAVDGLLAAIRLAPTADTLVRLWHHNRPQWTDAHTAAAAHRKTQLTKQAA